MPPFSKVYVLCIFFISSIYLFIPYIFNSFLWILVSQIIYSTKLFYYIEGFEICFCLWENSLKIFFLSSHSFSLKVLFFFNYFCMCLCVYMHIWVWYLWSPEEGIGRVGTRITPHVLHFTLWVPWNESSPLKEKQALLIAKTSIKIPTLTVLIRVWFLQCVIFACRTSTCIYRHVCTNTGSWIFSSV